MQQRSADVEHRKREGEWPRFLRRPTACQVTANLLLDGWPQAAAWSIYTIHLRLVRLLCHRLDTITISDARACLVWQASILTRSKQSPLPCSVI